MYNKERKWIGLLLQLNLFNINYGKIVVMAVSSAQKSALQMLIRYGH